MSRDGLLRMGAASPQAYDRRTLLFGAAGLLLVAGLPGTGVAAAPRVEPNRGDRTDLGEAARLSALCRSRNAIGVGLKGEYFSAEALQGAPSVTRIDTAVAFGSSDELLQASGLQRIGSVRWSGWVKAHVGGRFRFDGGAPNVRVIVSNIVLSGLQASSGTGIELSEGRYYPIRVELDHVSPAQQPVSLEWTVPYGARYAIPRQLLFLPTASRAG